MIDKSSQYRKQVRDFARVLYAYLKENCIGHELSTSDLVYETFPPTPLDSQDGEMNNSNISFFQYTDNELWDVHYALEAVVAQGHKYTMDGDYYANQCVGFPYNIPFIFRLKKDKHQVWEGNVPFFKSGRSYLKWLRDCEECIIDSTEIWQYLHRLKDIINSLGNTPPITEKDLERALMRTQVSGEMIDVVPNSNDESTYHIDFVPWEEYFRRHPKSIIS